MTSNENDISAMVDSVVIDVGEVVVVVVAFPSLFFRKIVVRTTTAIMIKITIASVIPRLIDSRLLSDFIVRLREWRTFSLLLV